jgi:hypothetical protein
MWSLPQRGRSCAFIAGHGLGNIDANLRVDGYALRLRSGLAMNASGVAAPAPVEPLPGESNSGSPEQGIAICLSGGGYRAMLFHTGVIWRLAELGMLAPDLPLCRPANSQPQRRIRNKVFRTTSS